jgi:beta-glucanase (GH16 family)
VFSDEFNASAYDAARWLPCYWWATTNCTSQPMNELELYTAKNILEGNGFLTLRATKLATPIQYCDKDCRSYTFGSGMVQSGGGQWPTRSAGFTFTYGYVEARVKIPAGKGLWPAFWLWPANYNDPPEIDIMENLGDNPNKIYMTYHLPNGSEAQGTYTGSDFSQGFHKLGLDWSATALVWYVDGVERFRWTGTTPNQPMYPIFNLAVGGNWPGSPDATTAFPADYVVDYVRIYNSPGF